MKVKTIAAAVLAVGLAAPIQAAVVFDGGAPDYQNGLLATSWFFEPDGAAATMFTVSGGGLSFNGINWWGAYNYFGNPDQPHSVLNSFNAFTFNLYNVVGGLPGALLRSIGLGTGNGAIDPGSPAADPDGQFTRVYQYSANFGQEVLADGSYFLSLSNAYAFNELSPFGDEENSVDFDWYWSATADSNLGAAYYDFGEWISGGDEGVFGLAFLLLGADEPTGNSVPEPGSMALLTLALALAGLVASRKRLVPQPAGLVAI